MIIDILYSNKHLYPTSHTPAFYFNNSIDFKEKHIVFQYSGC